MDTLTAEVKIQFSVLCVLPRNAGFNFSNVVKNLLFFRILYEIKKMASFLN